MVPVSVDKHHKVAVLEAVSIKCVSKMELGVCLGYSLNSPGASEFLLANGEIVSRNQFERVNVTPFDWKRKVVIQAELAPPLYWPLIVSGFCSRFTFGSGSSFAFFSCCSYIPVTLFLVALRSFCTYLCYFCSSRSSPTFCRPAC